MTTMTTMMVVVVMMMMTVCSVGLLLLWAQDFRGPVYLAGAPRDGQATRRVPNYHVRLSHGGPQVGRETPKFQLMKTSEGIY